MNDHKMNDHKMIDFIEQTLHIELLGYQKDLINKIEKASKDDRRILLDPYYLEKTDLRMLTFTATSILSDGKETYDG